MGNSISKHTIYDFQPFFIGCQEACKRLNKENVSHQEIEQLILTSIIFGACTLESFINHYAESRIDSEGWKSAEALDRISLESKWIVIPYVVCGIELDSQSSFFNEFHQIVLMRNSLVHGKPKSEIKYNKEFLCNQEKEDDKLERHFEEIIRDRKRVAKRADKIVINMVNELLKIDPDEEVEGIASSLSIPYYKE